MKIFVSLLLLGVSTLCADTRSALADTYAKGVNAILFFTSEDVISSGHYSFDNSDTTLNTHFIPFTYQFDSESDFYNFYANGSIGFSKYKEPLSATEELDITTYAVKVGGGVRFKIAEDADLMTGVSYLYSRSDSTFKSDKVLTDDIKEILNSSRTHHTYELSSSIGYHPTFHGYQPYARAGIRYFKTDIDTPYTTISETTSTLTKLKIGVITPPVTTLYGLPLKLEFYASEVFLAGDMDDVLGFDHFFMAGTTAHLGTSSLVSWVDEVTFDVNVVKGENFDGFNFGFGLSF
jgi:hypothetical protein